MFEKDEELKQTLTTEDLIILSRNDIVISKF